MTSDKQIHFYGAIEKFDALDDGLLVSGIASTEAVDADGEIVTAEAMRKALPSYLQSGTVREMHQPIAAGRPISAFVDDEGKTHFTAKIIDKDTIAKIKAGVLKGFSIGGKALKKVGKKIEEILLRDISVVDLPNNPESYFTVIKFDKPGDKCTDPECKNHHEAAVEKCGDCKSKIKKHEQIEFMDAEVIKKLDALAATVEQLTKSIETIFKNQSDIAKSQADITKVQTDIGDPQKKASEAEARAIEAEKSGIVAKMQAEGRVALKEDGSAFKADELQKMDLNMLKFASKNSQQIPTVAKATYSGTGNGPEDLKKFVKVVNGKEVALQGDELIAAGFEAAGYSDLQKMIDSQTK